MQGLPLRPALACKNSRNLGRTLLATPLHGKSAGVRAGDAFLKWQAGSQTANKSKVMKRVHATVGILCAHPVSL